MNAGDLVLFKHGGSLYWGELGIFIREGMKSSAPHDFRKSAFVLSPTLGLIETFYYMKAPSEECEQFWIDYCERKINETR